MSRNKDVALCNQYRYFVSDYDLKKLVKNFFKRPVVFVFLEHTQDFFTSQSVAQPGEGAKGASTQFSQVI